jgi:hypothetical protein
MNSSIVFDDFSLPDRPLVQFGTGTIRLIPVKSRGNPKSICGFCGSFSFFFGLRWQWVGDSRFDWVWSSSWHLGFDFRHGRFRWSLGSSGFEVVPLGSCPRGFRPCGVFFGSVFMEYFHLNFTLSCPGFN